jgi:hypothetical protein
MENEETYNSTTSSRRSPTTRRQIIMPTSDDSSSGKMPVTDSSQQVISSPSSTGTADFHSCYQGTEDPEAAAVAATPPPTLPQEEPAVVLVPTTSSSPSSLLETHPISSRLNTHPSTIARDGTLLEQCLFFGCGLGTSICYIATLSSLVYFKLLYGADSFVYLNLAVYLPLLPVSLAQARWDQYYDVQFQSRRTFLVRGIVGFFLGLLGTIQMIPRRGGHTHHSSSSSSSSGGGMTLLVLHALLQGTGGAILYGTLNQLASFVSTGDGRKLKTAVSAGVQASALVVLAVSLLTGFGVHNASRFPLFLGCITAIELVCLFLFLWLLLARPIVAAAMTRRDSSLVRSNDNDVDQDDAMVMRTPLIDSHPASLSSSSSRQNGTSAMELSFAELLRRSGSCCWVLFVTLVPSFLVGSWFTRVQTNWMALASWLFYIRIASDFLGRLATILVPPRTLTCLNWTCLVRLVPVTLFFLNAHTATQLVPAGDGPAADLFSIVLVAIIAFLSGYLVTGCFQLAPMGLDDWQVREANVAKQASLLTVAFSISAIGGLLSSFTFMALGV